MALIDDSRPIYLVGLSPRYPRGRSRAYEGASFGALHSQRVLIHGGKEGWTGTFFPSLPLSALGYWRFGTNSQKTKDQEPRQSARSHPNLRGRVGGHRSCVSLKLATD